MAYVGLGARSSQVLHERRRFLYVCSLSLYLATSMPALVRYAYPRLGRLVPSALFRHRFDALARIGDVETPTMLLSGQNDKHVPIKMMDDLFEASGATIKCIERFPSGTLSHALVRDGGEK